MKPSRAFLLVLTIALLSPMFAETPPALAQNNSLIQNGDFESGNLSLWDTCGGARLADTQAGATALEVHSGRYALRLGSPTDNTCGDVLSTQMQAYYYNIVVPTDAAALTWSFWYSRVGDFGGDAASWTLNALLVSADDGPQVRILEYISPGESGGWNEARFELSSEEVAQARGRTFYISFTFYFSLSEDSHLAYYIDDMHLLPSTVRTPIEATAPPALANDTSRALVGYTVADGKGITARANLNGTNPLPLYEGHLGNGGSKPRWSKNGAQIGVLEDILQPEPGEPISINSAQITTLTVMNADGSGQREVYRTIGKKLVPGTPPGCRPPRTDCAPYDNPAIDSFIAEFDWSPDGRTVALNICNQSRYGDGHTDDAICSIQFLDVATGALQAGKIEPAFGVDWSTANRLIYRVNIEGPFLYNTPKGVYEADMSVSPPTTRLLFAHYSQTYTLEDVGSTWSPDGRHFVTLRFVQGNHYDAAGQKQYNAVLMLFDRENPDTPRQLVLVDFGRTISTPTWSPDGSYIAYNVEVGDNSWETWWLEVASGKTGLLTGDMIFADWRPVGGTAALKYKLYLPSLVK